MKYGKERRIGIAHQALRNVRLVSSRRSEDLLPCWHGNSSCVHSWEEGTITMEKRCKTSCNHRRRLPLRQEILHSLFHRNPLPVSTIHVEAFRRKPSGILDGSWKDGISRWKTDGRRVRKQDSYNSWWLAILFIETRRSVKGNRKSFQSTRVQACTMARVLVLSRDANRSLAVRVASIPGILFGFVGSSKRPSPATDRTLGITLCIQPTIDALQMKRVVATTPYHRTVVSRILGIGWTSIVRCTTDSTHVFSCTPCPNTYRSPTLDIHSKAHS